MANEKPHHIEGVFALDEGAGGPVDSGSELHHKVNGKQLRLARHVYPGTARLMPGHWAHARVTFDQPDAVAQSFWVERDVDVYRGTDKVGTLQVTGVLSPALAGSAWTLRQASVASVPPARVADTLVIIAGYLFFVVPTVYLAIRAYTPCETNFEGGCGMARGMMAILSLLSAAAAWLIGVALNRQLLKHPLIARKAPTSSLATSLLWATPLFYLLFTLRALFFG